MKKKTERSKYQGGGDSTVARINNLEEKNGGKWGGEFYIDQFIPPPKKAKQIKRKEVKKSL